MTRSARPARRRTIILWILVPILAFTLATSPLVYLMNLRSPQQTPTDYLAEPYDVAGKLVVVAGASTVRGTASGDFVGKLRERMAGEGHEFLNAGVNGNTSADLLAALDEVIAVGPDVVIVLVGTNDVLDGEDTCSVPDDYYANMDSALDRLDAETDAELALTSIQPLGEALDDEMNSRVNALNEVVEQLAGEHGTGYLPLNEQLSDIIRDEGSAPPFSFTPLSVLWTTARYYYFGQSWDEVGHANGYVVLTDGVHLNDRAASIAADLAAVWLNQQIA